ncbi:MAG: hypothetical protein IKI57_02455 [Clostridia bacterium]|nr:hypothetical protein [Clostridia bacterium]
MFAFVIISYVAYNFLKATLTVPAGHPTFKKLHATGNIKKSNKKATTFNRCPYLKYKILK